MGEMAAPKLTITTNMLRPATPPSPSAWLAQASPGRPKSSHSENHARPAIRNIFMTPPVKTAPRAGHSRPITFLPVSRPDRTSQSSLSSLLSLTSDNLALSVYSSTPSRGSITPLTPPETPSKAKHPIQQADIFRVGELVDPRYEYYLTASACSSPSSPAPSLDSFHSAQSAVADPGEASAFPFGNDAFPEGSPDDDLPVVDADADPSCNSEEAEPISEVDETDSTPAASEHQNVKGRLLQARSRLSRANMEKHLVLALKKSAAGTSEAMVLLSRIRQLKLARVQQLPSEDDAEDDGAASVTDEADENAYASSDDYEGTIGDTHVGGTQRAKASLLRRARSKLDARFRPPQRDVFASDENLLSSVVARGNKRGRKLRPPLKALAASSAKLLVDTRTRIAGLTASPARAHALAVALRTPHVPLGSRFSTDADSLRPARKSRLRSLFKPASP